MANNSFEEFVEHQLADIDVSDFATADAEDSVRYGRHLLEIWDHLVMHFANDLLEASEVSGKIARAGRYLLEDGVTLEMSTANEGLDVYAHVTYPRELLDRLMAELGYDEAPPEADTGHPETWDPDTDKGWTYDPR